MGTNKILLIVALVIIVLAGGYYGYTKMTKESLGDDYMMGDQINDQDGDDMNLTMPASDESGEGVDEMMVGGDGQVSGDEMMSDVKEFTVEGDNFAFSVKEIKVKQGDKVKITFNNIEGFHDLIIDEFGVNTGQIRAGESKTVEFIADKTGTFEYYCSVGQHRANGMFGQLIVE